MITLLNSVTFFVQSSMSSPFLWCSFRASLYTFWSSISRNSDFDICKTSSGASPSTYEKYTKTISDKLITWNFCNLTVTRMKQISSILITFGQRGKWWREKMMFSKNRPGICLPIISWVFHMVSCDTNITQLQAAHRTHSLRYGVQICKHWYGCQPQEWHVSVFAERKNQICTQYRMLNQLSPAPVAQWFKALNTGFGGKVLSSIPHSDPDTSVESKMRKLNEPRGSF